MGLFRKRARNRSRTPAEASLARAQAARRAQERKREDERPVRQKLDRLIEENHLAELMRDALGGR